MYVTAPPERLLARHLDLKHVKQLERGIIAHGFSWSTVQIECVIEDAVLYEATQSGKFTTELLEERLAQGVGCFAISGNHTHHAIKNLHHRYSRNPMFLKTPITKLFILPVDHNLSINVRTYADRMNRIGELHKGPETHDVVAFMRKMYFEALEKGISKEEAARDTKSYFTSTAQKKIGAPASRGTVGFYFAMAIVPENQWKMIYDILSGNVKPRSPNVPPKPVRNGLWFQASVDCPPAVVTKYLNEVVEGRFGTGDFTHSCRKFRARVKLENLILSTLCTVSDKPQGFFQTIQQLRETFPFYDQFFSNAWMLRCLAPGNIWKMGNPTSVTIPQWIHDDVKKLAKDLVKQNESMAPVSPLLSLQPFLPSPRMDSNSFLLGSDK